MIALRGHHMFCTTLFSGSGYDRAFAENMRELIENMQKGEEVQLAEGCALGTGDVSRRDAAALEVTGMVPGQVLDWRGLKERLEMVSERDFQHVCGDCRWQREGLCSYPLLRERVRP